MSREEPVWHGGGPEDELFRDLKAMLADRYLFAIPADSPAHAQAATELYMKIGAYFVREIEDGMQCHYVSYSSGDKPPTGGGRSVNEECPVQCFYAAKAIQVMVNGRQYL